MKQCFYQKRNTQLFCLGALLGLLIFLLVFGVQTLNVANDAFCRGGFIEKDIQQHYAGWLFYRQSAVNWPLCIAQNINAPAGLSVAYTDSIPLFAAFFHLFEAVLPQTFQYFGWFTLFCFVLQGGFAALLCGLFSKKLAIPLLGSLLFTTSPVLFERVFRHTSLGAQFFVVAVLYYYFSLRRQNKPYSVGLFVLNLLAIGVHPYYLPMVYAVTLALVVEYAVRSKRFAKPFLLLAANLGGTVLLGYCLGLFYNPAASGGQALYGYFAMNLNALFNPSGVNGLLYSRIVPALGQVGGNYDAFAYLGLGVLLALPVAFVLVLRRPAGMWRRHWALGTICVVLCAFAVSNVITLGGATLLNLPLPPALIELFSVFRSGGRLFWPVYYLLMLFAFAMLARLPNAVVAVAVLAAVQIFDVSPGLVTHGAAMQDACREDAFPTALTSDFWQAATRYDHIASMDNIQDDALHLALFAADNSMTTNDPFAARYDSAALAAQREELTAELAAGTLRSDTLYLFEYEGSFLQAVEPVKQDAWCGAVTGPDESTWYVIAPGLQDDAFDAACTPYDDAYPLRLADYTDALWNRGVLDSTKQTVCFADAPFTRTKLQGATALCTDSKAYPITEFNDSDPGWLILTLEIDDATVLWQKELTVQ